MVRKSKKFLTPKWLLLAAVIVIAIILSSVLALSNRKTVSTIPSSSPNKTEPGLAGSNDKNPLPSSSATNTAGSETTKNNGQTTSTPLTLDAAQTLVSNHYPGKNGSPTTEQSVCNTTPGASCYIQFTMGNATKKLSAQVAGSSGATIWNWDINTAGLTSGSWQITAVASLGNQTKTASDPQALVIQ